MKIFTKLKQIKQKIVENKKIKERNAYLQQICEDPSIIATIGDMNYYYIDDSSKCKILQFYKYRDDREIALVFLKQNPLLYYYLSDDLKKDKEFAMIYATSHSAELFDIPKELLDDKDVVLAFVKTGIRYHSEHFADCDKHIINQKHLFLPKGFDFAPFEHYKEERMECLKNFHSKNNFQKYCFNIGQEKLNKEFYIYNISTSSCFFDNKEFMDEIIKLDPNNAIFASPRLFDTKDYVLKVVSIDGKNIRRASKRLREDDQCALKAVQNDGLSLQFIPEKKYNKKICLYAIKQNKDACVYVGENLMYNSLKTCSKKGLHDFKLLKEEQLAENNRDI